MTDTANETPAEPPLTEKTLARELDAFIRKRFRVGDDDATFHHGTDVWAEGYVDSAGVVEVMAFLESRVGRRLPEELLFEPEFVTIEGMARLVLKSAA